jgi:hypothetical protein
VTENNFTAGEDQYHHEIKGSAIGRESTPSIEDSEAYNLGALARRGGETSHGE